MTALLVIQIMCELLEAPVLQPYKVIIEKRYNQCVTPTHFVAYQGHPKYEGAKLTVQQEELSDWLANINDNFLPPLLALD